jgi:hypothetical protein
LIFGWRSQDFQDKLRKRWHDIADKPNSAEKSTEQVCRELRAAGFAQLPTGVSWDNQNDKSCSRISGDITYRPDGATAKGGPAERSRHTDGEAADLTVTWPVARNLARFKAAAKAAGLCGPPRVDDTHVELGALQPDGTRVCSRWSTL